MILVCYVKKVLICVCIIDATVTGIFNRQRTIHGAGGSPAGLGCVVILGWSKNMTNISFFIFFVIDIKIV